MRPAGAQHLPRQEFDGDREPQSDAVSGFLPTVTLNHHGGGLGQGLTAQRPAPTQSTPVIALKETPTS
jgi:hypothetical protein